MIFICKVIFWGPWHFVHRMKHPLVTTSFILKERNSSHDHKSKNCAVLAWRSWLEGIFWHTYWSDFFFSFWILVMNNFWKTCKIAIKIEREKKIQHFFPSFLSIPWLEALSNLTPSTNCIYMHFYANRRKSPEESEKLFSINHRNHKIATILFKTHVAIIWERQMNIISTLSNGIRWWQILI